MVKHTQLNCLSVFDHFVGLALKWWSANPKKSSNTQPTNCFSVFDHFAGWPLWVKDRSKIILPFFLFDFSFSSICLIIWKDKYPQININGVISMKTKLNVELSKNSDIWDPKGEKWVLHLLNFTLQAVLYTVTYSELSQASNLQRFVKIVYGF